MENILKHILREQAGSNTYNRYEYQVGWSVLKAIEKYEKKIPFTHFAEYHDDMSELVNTNKMNFYQVKTKQSANFTFNLITKKYANKQHSFLGYLFYNHLNFKDDCKECYFISNRPFDEKINTWQAIVQDNNLLINSDPELYNEIFNILKTEYNYTNMAPSEKQFFDLTFDKFIQNTFFKQSNIPLENSYSFVKTRFFEAIKFERIEMSSAHLIFEAIFDVVRTRTKQTIIPPISLNELKEKKGMNESIFSDVQTLRDKENIVTIKQIIKDFCLENRSYFSITKESQLLRAITNHYTNQLDPSNISYKLEINKYIDEFKSKIDCNIDSLDSVDNLIALETETINSILPNIENPLINKVTLEVLFYVEFLRVE